MAKAHTTWRVLPHGPIEKLSERVWRVEGEMEGMPLKRVMTVAKRADGGLVIHNAIPLDDAGMAQIEQWGPVRVIVVPNGYHRLDAKVFADRFPQARVICPAGVSRHPLRHSSAEVSRARPSNTVRRSGSRCHSARVSSRPTSR